MKRLAFALGILAIALTTTTYSNAKETDQNESQYTAAQVRKMAHEARTAEQYTVIADYYARQQQICRQKAAEEMHLWETRSATLTPLNEKWPSPVDSARNLHDYYEYEAVHYGALFLKYRDLATKK